MRASEIRGLALAGHVSRAMMERYSHIRMEAKHKAVDTLSGTNFEPGVAQNWAQFFVSEKSDEANSLKTSGEPGRTRTSNPLLIPETLCSWFFKHFLASCITVFHGVWHGFVPRAGFKTHSSSFRISSLREPKRGFETASRLVPRSSKPSKCRTSLCVS